jgi:ribosomal protein S18 acetylase RimI-like enzyme
VIGLLDGLAAPGEGMMPGFVWLEAGQVVGTASVRRINRFHQGWLISNVAVHPDWQGRGIGRALMEASLDFAEAYGASWVVLQVRDHNRVARQLYESLGFASIGQVLRLRLDLLEAELQEPHIPDLRRARWSDGDALARMSRQAMPRDMVWSDALNRDLYRTGLLGALAARLKGIRRRWWVVGRDSVTAGLRAAVGVETDAEIPWHRLRLLMKESARDQHLVSALIHFGLWRMSKLSPLPIVTEYPTSDEMAQQALLDAGFQAEHSLVHMRLDF